MIWKVRIEGVDELVLRVTDSFLHQLFTRVHDPTVKQLDPYRDASLDQSTMTRWQHELARVKQEIRTEVGHRLVRERNLPREPTFRDVLLREWIDQELSTNEHFQMLVEVEAAVNLTLEAAGVIEVLGD